MPYKRIGTTVKVKRRGRWEVLKRYPKGQEQQAQDYREALYANVSEARKEAK